MFNRNPYHHLPYQLLKLGIYLLLIRNDFIILSLRYFFSPENIIQTQHTYSFPNRLDFIVNAINTFELHSFLPYIIIFHMLVLGFSYYLNIRWLSIIVFFLTLNISHATVLIRNGSGLLINNLLFFMIWMDGKNRYRLFSLGRWGFIIQLCYVYIFSVLYKLSGTHWLNGDALFYALNYELYSKPFLAKASFKYAFLFVGLNYFVLLYQFVFPIVVLLKKKGVFLLVGVLIHLFIALFMGIFDFGMLMIICYLIFFSDEDMQKIKFFYR